MRVKISIREDGNRNSPLTVRIDAVREVTRLDVDEKGDNVGNRSLQGKENNDCKLDPQVFSG